MMISRVHRSNQPRSCMLPSFSKTAEDFTECTMEESEEFDVSIFERNFPSPSPRTAFFSLPYESPLSRKHSPLSPPKAFQKFPDSCKLEDETKLDSPLSPSDSIEESLRNLFSGAHVSAELPVKASEAELPKRKFEINDLERHRILGEGQFGQVLLVSEKNASSRTPYALKVHAKYDLIEAGEAESVLREKETLQKLKGNTFIVELVDSFQDEKMVYLLQEFCQGGELFSIIAEKYETGLPESQASFYTLCIADALSFMHDRNIFYRDLKPENVMLGNTGYPKLIDMGSAKILDTVDDVTYTFCGTPRFVSPEAIHSTGQSFPSDRWALGILIYEMLTGGENPFYYDGMDETTLFQVIVRDDYLALPETVSSQAQDLVSRLLDKSPDTRLGQESLLQHSWMEAYDIEAMRRKESVAPWVPDVSGALDTSCFDCWDHLENRVDVDHPQLTTKEDAIFSTF